MVPRNNMHKDKLCCSELELTGNIKYLSKEVFEMKNLTALHVSSNSLSNIPAAINQLANLLHLNISNNHLTDLPPQLGDLLSLEELILSYNFLTSLPYEMGRLFKLSKLEVDGNPLSYDILQLYRRCSVKELLHYLLENLAFDMENKPLRQWIPISNPNPSQRHCNFKIMSYNLLCEKYATAIKYPYCPGWALTWEYRRQKIMNEILQYEADIISLQETEEEVFYNFFLDKLRSYGYDGVFSPKSRARTMPASRRKRVDGCAIFFKTNKFVLVKEYLVEFNQLAMRNSEGCHNMLNRTMTKDNIALVALLQTRRGAYGAGSDLSQTLLVCTTHIHWDPEYSDVKMIQTMMLMQELESIVKDTLQSGDNLQKDVSSIPLLLCGDFNSLPNSGVVEFLSSGRVSTQHSDFKQIDYERCLTKFKSSIGSQEYSHPFKISRAYNDEIMPFTNYSYYFKAVIDYIFYSHLNMTTLGVLGPIDETWLQTNRVHGCPHPHIPSDHFPIVAELQLAPTEPIHPAPLNGIALHR